MLKRDPDQETYPEIHLKSPDKPEWHRISGRSRHPSGSRCNFVEITPKHARRGAIKHPRGDPRYTIEAESPTRELHAGAGEAGTGEAGTGC